MSKSQRELMLEGELYIANDPELNAARRRARQLLARFNSSNSEAFAERREILEELFSSFGKGSLINPTLRCDYGFNIAVGKNSFFNFDCVLLDCNRIDIGDDVQFGPGVHVYTATHPMDAAERRSGKESARPIKIESGVWIGGRAVVCPRRLYWRKHRRRRRQRGRQRPSCQCLCRRQSMQSHQGSGIVPPNPSIERTRPGKPGRASHVKR